MKMPKLNITLSRKQKTLLITCLILTTIDAGLVLADFRGIVLWSKWHDVEIKTPLLTQRPIVITELETETNGLLKTTTGRKEILTQADKTRIVYAGGLGEPVEKIRTLESGRGENSEGHHKFCESIGKTNEFGFFAGGNRKYCFDTFEESVEGVTDWLRSELVEMPLDVALCYYNKGSLMDTCKYSQDYHAL